jgi:4'-phosphopantetheinyl transferase
MRSAHTFVLAARPADVLHVVGDRFLTPPERRRAGALRHRDDRDAYVAAHALVRECAAQLAGFDAGSLEVVQRCPECRAAGHGKPFLRGHQDVHLSLAHSRRAVVAGAGWAPVGVDVEDVDGTGASTTDPGFMASVLTPAEMDGVRSAAEPHLAFLRLWVRKESLVKLGVVTLDTVRHVNLRGGPPGAGDDRPESRYGSLHVIDWVDPILGAAFAVAAAEPPVVGTFPTV